MKHLKTINELFDSPELKTKFEIPYLKGEMPLTDYIKSAKLKQEDPLLGHIVQYAPFIMPLGYIRSGNLLSIGFNKVFLGHDKYVALFTLEIRENRDGTCIANLYSKIYKNGKAGYNNDINKGVMTSDKLIEFIRTEVLDALVEMCIMTKVEFDWSILKTTDKNKLRAAHLLN